MDFLAACTTECKYTDLISPRKGRTEGIITRISSYNEAREEITFGLFVSLHLVPIWTEFGTDMKVFTVTIVQPSGVNAYDITIYVLEGCLKWELSLKWLLFPNDVEILQRNGFQNLKEVCKNATKIIEP